MHPVNMLLQVWKSEHSDLKSSLVGSYEGKFFNLAMDRLRGEGGKEGEIRRAGVKGE